jgi:predicted flap endonuclease-1-like 5' DNA nuclease
MKRSQWSVVAVVLLLALVAPSGVVLADNGGDGGRIVFGDDFVLASGETLDGDLAVFGGNVTLEQGSTVVGDLLAMGGSIAVDGVIDGDVVAFGGNVDLGPSAEVDGDLVALGGTVTGSEEAVRGRISEGFTLPSLPQIATPPMPGSWPMRTGGRNIVVSWLVGGIRAFASALVLALLAIVVVSLWPRQTELLVNTVWRAPAASVGTGLLTYLIVLGLLVLLIITICLSPLLAVATAVAFLFGWIALGWLVGRRLLAALNAKSVAPIWEASLGVFLLTLLGAIPCIGWLAWVVGGAFGLGAVVLTRFGTRRFNGSAAVRPEVLPDATPTPIQVAEEDVQDVDQAPLVEEDVEGPEMVSVVSEPADLEVSQAAADASDPAQEAWDDLELIHGIGPVFAGRLRAQGINTFAQLSEADPDALAAMVDLFPDRVREDDWVGQAKRLLE